MTLTIETGTGRQSLRHRLVTVAPLVLEAGQGIDVYPGESELLDHMVQAVLDDLQVDRLWALFTAVAARYPTPDELQDGMRTFELSEALDATLWLLDCALSGASGGSAPGREIAVARDAVLVDVTHSAQHDLHTGIQQVVRQLLPRWSKGHDVIPVVWTERSGALRTLSPAERHRVLSWGGEPPVPALEDDTDEIEIPLLVPWHCTLVLAEVPFGDAPHRLSALARCPGNHLVAVGYDCIPVVSADLVPIEDSSRFVNYLSMIKHVERVAAISASSTAEFQGFVDTLSTQGLRGPAVMACVLPDTADHVTPAAPQKRRRPLVLMVGSFEPRKNHLDVLHAAETLWRAGVDFDLTFIGGSGWGTELPERIDKLTRAGRPINVLHKVDLATRDGAYASARFTVFPSKHEGFGLPVAESLAAGTPVITSNFGSMRELASAGGAIMIDPYDDAALVAAMRTLLTDDGALEELRRQIAARPRRDWDDYAGDLWSALVAPPVPAAVA